MEIRASVFTEYTIGSYSIYIPWNTINILARNAWFAIQTVTCFPVRLYNTCQNTGCLQIIYISFNSKFNHRLSKNESQLIHKLKLSPSQDVCTFTGFFMQEIWEICEVNWMWSWLCLKSLDWISPKGERRTSMSIWLKLSMLSGPLPGQNQSPAVEHHGRDASP